MSDIEERVNAALTWDIGLDTKAIIRDLMADNAKLRAALKSAADDLDEHGLPVEARKARRALERK